MAEDPRKALERIQGSEKKDQGGELPATTKLSIDVEGTRGRRYKHTFTYTVPTLGQQIDIGKLKSLYLPQGASADSNAALLVEQICYLTITIDQKTVPDWWVPMEMHDATPIGALYKEALDYERKFHGGSRSADDGGAGSGVDGEAEDEGGSSAPPDGGVGDGAQPPAKRRKTLSSS